MTNRFIIAAMAAAAMGTVAGAARAETAPAAAAAAPSDWEAYGSLGYNYLHAKDSGTTLNLGALTGRVGVRYMGYVGVEAEVSGGVADATLAGATASLDSQYAVYLVGYLPVSPQADLFARVGRGSAKFKASYLGASASASTDTWAFGAGGQYFLTPKDGVRAEYTRYSASDNGTSGDVDSFSVSYVRKF